ncbi:mCG1038757, partial [Mus musculus]
PCVPGLILCLGTGEPGHCSRCPITQICASNTMVWSLATFPPVNYCLHSDFTDFCFFSSRSDTGRDRELCTGGVLKALNGLFCSSPREQCRFAL